MLTVERHVAAGHVDVRDELPTPELHEFVDADARAVKGL